MFGELLESRAKPVRNRAGTIASIAGHAVLVALAVAATRSPLVARGPVEQIVTLPDLTATTEPRPIDAAGPVRRSASAAPTAPEPPAVSVPVIALPGIPPVELAPMPSIVTGWSPESASRPSGVGAGASSGATDGIPLASGVDKPAMALAGNPSPRYPEVLRRARVRGQVVVQVVIDTTGRADMASLRIVSSDHPLLTDAVVAVLPRARFLPAESGGRKVRMWAVQSFVFEVR